MRIRLRGINSRRKRLADGTMKTYWWAWKGGPPLDGKPGSPEFIDSYNQAIAGRRKVGTGTVLSLLQRFQSSDDFLSRSPRTRLDYIYQIKVIEKVWGDFPLAALSDPRTRGRFMEWRDELALRSRRQADYAWTVLARVMAWSKGRGYITTNPCEKGGRLYRGTRAEKIWTDDDLKRYFDTAPKHLHLPVILALWTGQRQGDLLALTWFAYDGAWIRLEQFKTGRRMKIPVGKVLKAALDAVPNRAGRILVNSNGTPWTPDGFRSSFNKARLAARVTGLTFHDLRGSAVTRLAEANASVPEIATFTGHSLRDVQSILDANYLARTDETSLNALRKLETGTKNPD